MIRTLDALSYAGLARSTTGTTAELIAPGVVLAAVPATALVALVLQAPSLTSLTLEALVTEALTLTPSLALEALVESLTLTPSLTLEALVTTKSLPSSLTLEALVTESLALGPLVKALTAQASTEALAAAAAAEVVVYEKIDQTMCCDAVQPTLTAPIVVVLVALHVCRVTSLIEGECGRIYAGNVVRWDSG